jgi:hypothetical protein
MKKVFLLTAYILATCCSLLAQDTIYLKKYVSNLKQVTITIDGQTYSFIFDSGGGETFISPAIAKRLGKTVYGQATSFRMSGEKINYQKCDSVTLKAGNTSLLHSTIGVWDIMSILPAGLPKIDGVLSLKSFKDNKISLDLANERLVLETDRSFKRAVQNKTLVPSLFATGMNGNELTIFLGTFFQQHLYWFLFDSGNLNDLLLSSSIAKQWGLQKDTAHKRVELGTVSLTLGRKKIEQAAAAEPIIYDGALNYAILSKQVFFIDLPLRKVWMQ